MLIIDKILYCTIDNLPSKKYLMQLINKREVTEVFLDIGQTELLDEKLLSLTINLHLNACAACTLSYPLIIGPVSINKVYLRRQLALKSIRTTDEDFNHHLDRVRLRRLKRLN